MSDLFNNISNDYVYPDLAACSGTSDFTVFEFLPGKQTGIISGSQIVSAMNLSDISQEVTAWVQQAQYLNQGEVVFIPGLTKGISHRTQVFPIIGDVIYNTPNDKMYMSIDISINYYKNFKYHQTSITAQADKALGIDLKSAVNLVLFDSGIDVKLDHKPEEFIFTGNFPGYDFEITDIYVERFVPDTSVVSAYLDENLDRRIPAQKYPNSGMLGYLLKVTYPPNILQDELKYVQLSHVPTKLVYYEEDPSNPGLYERLEKIVDVGKNGNSTDTIISAGDYLHYITSNEKWEKVGIFRGWLSTTDPANSTITNLINGFYLLNPHTFPVKIEYMTIT